MRINVLTSMVVLSLIMLCVYLTVALIVTRPTHDDKYAHCKIANQCKVDGYTFFVIAEGGKK
jgi:hypothetical protein